MNPPYICVYYSTLVKECSGVAIFRDFVIIVQMKSPDQLKNTAKKIALPATTGFAGLLMLAGCGNKQEVSSDKESVGPVTEITAEYIPEPFEPKGMQVRPYFPPQPKNKHCIHYDVSPTALPEEHQSRSITMNPPNDTRGLFGDSYKSVFKGFSPEVDGIIRIIQSSTDGESVSVSNISTSDLDEVSAKYIRLEDSVENGASVGFLVDSAETPDQRAEVWMQICTDMEIPQAPASQGQTTNSTAA